MAWRKVRPELYYWLSLSIGEPVIVGLIFLLALKIPRRSVWADFMFMLGVLANFLFRVGLFNKRSPVKMDIDVSLLWYFQKVSMFVFAGFHDISLITFWFGIVFATLACGNTEPQDLTTLGVGLATAATTIIINCSITRYAESFEQHRKAEQVLLEYATDASCVVEAQTGAFLETSRSLEKICGLAIQRGAPLQQLVVSSDHDRVRALLEDAANGSLGAALVTIQMTSDDGHLFFQDMRVVAYSTSRYTTKLCLQFLGERRPVMAHSPSNNSIARHIEDYSQYPDRQLSAQGPDRQLSPPARYSWRVADGGGEEAGISNSFFLADPSDTQAHSLMQSMQQSPFGTALLLNDAQISPPVSQAGSVSQATVLQEAGWQLGQGMVSRAVGALDNQRASVSPRARSNSRSTAQMTPVPPWVGQHHRSQTPSDNLSDATR